MKPPITIDEWTDGFYEFAASFSVPLADAARVDMLSGRDPTGQRWLQRQEEIDAVLPYLRFVTRVETADMSELVLWRTVFSEIDSMHSLSFKDLVAELWARALQDVKVHALVYGFRSISDLPGYDEFNREARKLVEDVNANWRQLCEPGRSIFAMTLPKSVFEMCVSGGWLGSLGRAWSLPGRGTRLTCRMPA